MTISHAALHQTGAALGVLLALGLFWDSQPPIGASPGWKAGAASLWNPRPAATTKFLSRIRADLAWFQPRGALCFCETAATAREQRELVLQQQRQRLLSWAQLAGCECESTTVPVADREPQRVLQLDGALVCYH